MSGRKSAFWMEQIDEQIMEYIRHNGWVSPGVLKRERSISASEGRIAERCLYLFYAGLIEPIAGDMYDLTSDGLLYLRGELDAEHLPVPTPSKVFKDRYACPGRYPPGRGSSAPDGIVGKSWNKYRVKIRSSNIGRKS